MKQNYSLCMKLERDTTFAELLKKNHVRLYILKVKTK